MHPECSRPGLVSLIGLGLRDKFLSAMKKSIQTRLGNAQSESTQQTAQLDFFDDINRMRMDCNSKTAYIICYSISCQVQTEPLHLCSSGLLFSSLVKCMNAALITMQFYSLCQIGITSL